MKRVTHQAVEQRLAKWKSFFETGKNCPPGAEYGDDPLVDFALNSASPQLQILATDLGVWAAEGEFQLNY